jgi:DNA-binding transcriptional ArsR family regulator
MMTIQTTQSNLNLTLAALADPTRRAILERLSKGESRVTELAQPFTMSLNAVSKHIRILERAQLVRRRCAGREHFLSLNREPLDEAAAWIESQRAIWTARLDALAGLLQPTNERDERLRAENRRKTPAKKTPKKKGRSR